MAKKRAMGELVRSNIKQLAPQDAYHLTTPTINHHIASSSPVFDLMPRRGCGPIGLPGGKITELYGINGAGKTIFAARVCAAVQALGGFATWIASEGIDEVAKEHLVGDMNLLDKIGVIRDDPDRWIYAEVFTLEAAFGVAQGAIIAVHDSPLPSVTVIDAVSSLEASENAMNNKGMGDGKSAAAGAKTCHQFARSGIQYYLSGSNSILIIIRHQTENPRPFAGNEKTSHGSAFDFATWLRLRFRSKPLTKSDTDKTKLGSWITITCTKSKMGGHGWKVSMPWYWDTGWDPGMEILTWLLDNCEDIKKDANGRVIIPELGKNKFPSQWRKDYATDEGLQHEMQTILLERFRQQ